MNRGSFELFLISDLICFHNSTNLSRFFPNITILFSWIADRICKVFIELDNPELVGADC